MRATRLLAFSLKAVTLAQRAVKRRVGPTFHPSARSTRRTASLSLVRSRSEKISEMSATPPSSGNKRAHPEPEAGQRSLTSQFSAQRPHSPAPPPPSRPTPGAGVSIQVKLFPRGITQVVGDTKNTGVQNCLLKPLGFTWQSAPSMQLWQHDVDKKPEVWPPKGFESAAPREFPLDPSDELKRRAERDGVAIELIDCGRAAASRPKVSVKDLMARLNGAAPPADAAAAAASSSSTMPTAPAAATNPSASQPAACGYHFCSDDALLSLPDPISPSTSRSVPVQPPLQPRAATAPPTPPTRPPIASANASSSTAAQQPQPQPQPQQTLNGSANGDSGGTEHSSSSQQQQPIADTYEFCDDDALLAALDAAEANGAITNSTVSQPPREAELAALESPPQRPRRGGPSYDSVEGSWQSCFTPSDDA